MKTKGSILKKFVSAVLIVSMVINILPNFGLLTNKVQASTVDAKVILEIDENTGIIDDGTYRGFSMNIFVNNFDTKSCVTSFVLPIKYDNTKTKPALPYYRRGVFQGEFDGYAETVEDFIEGQVHDEIVANASGSTSEMGAEYVDLEFFKESGADIVITEKTLVCTVYFIIEDSTITDLSQIDNSIISLDKEKIEIFSADLRETTHNESDFALVYAEKEEVVVTGLTISGDYKSSYVIGENLDLTGMIVTASYSDDTTKVLTDSEYTTNASELDLTTEGTKILTVTYLGTDIAEGAEAPTASVDINVRKAKIKSLRIDGLESSYKQGTEIDLSKISVIAIDEKDNEKLLTTDKYTLTSTGNSIVNGKIKLDNVTDTIITATYEGTDIAEGVTIPLTATHTITITAKILTGIKVISPTKDVYIVGEKLDLTGLEVKAIYDNDETKPETVTGYTITPANGTELTTHGVQTITVTYGDKSATVDVFVFPTKLVGTEGNNLSTVDVPEDFAWESDSTILAVGENEYTLKFINTSPDMEKSCNVKVLGIPSNLTATYGDKLSDVKYNGGALPTGFAWENADTLVGDAGEQTHNITYTGYTGLIATVEVDKKALTKEDITPSITLPASSIYDGSKKEITVTLPEGAGIPTVTYYKQNGNNATEMKNVDTYTVKVSVEEGKNYKALVETEIGTYTIGKTNLKKEDFDINGIPQNNTKEYDGQAVTVTATVKEGIIGAGTTAIIKYYKDGDTVGTTIAPSDYGTYEIKVNINEGENYWAADGTPGLPEISLGSFTITGTTLKNTDVTFKAPENLEYDGTEKTATVEIPEKAGEVTVKYYKDGVETDPIDVGEYIVKITTTGGDNFAEVTEPMEVGTFTITPKPVTVTIENKSGVYGEDLKELTTIIPEGAVVSGDDLGITLSKAEGTDVAEYEITGEASNDNYDVTFESEDGTSNKGKYEITQKSITVTIQNATSEYKAELAELVCETNDTLVSGDTIEGIVKLSTTATSASNVGTYDITGEVINNNYSVTFTNEDDKGIYEITRSKLKLADFDVINMPENNQKKFDGQPLTVDATVKSGIVGAGETITIKYYKDGALATDTSVYGTYTVKININEGDNYFAADGTDGKEEIEIGTVTITPKDFDASKITYTKTSEYDGNVKTDDISIADDEITAKTVKYYQVIDGQKTEVEPINAGTYTIEADITTKSSGPIGIIPIGEYTITQRAITVTINDAESTYGEEIKKAEGNITEGSLATTDTIETVVKFTKAEGTDAKEYKITGKSINNNYNVTFANEGTYTITQKPITVTIGNADSVYGENVDLSNVQLELADGYELAYEDEIANLGITLDTDAGTAGKTDAGEYTITGTDNDNNYEITFVDGTYEITKATLKESDFDRTIEDVEFGTTVSIEATYKNGITEAYAGTISVKYYKEDGTTEVANPTEVGKYIVKVSTTGGKNYFAADGIKLGEFNITKSTEPFILTGVTFEDKTVIYNGVEQTITVTGVIPAGVIVSYTGNAGTNVGKYNATATFTIDETSELYEQYGSIKVEGTQGNTLTAILTIDKKDPKDEPDTYGDDLSKLTDYEKPYKTILSEITLPTGNNGTFEWKKPSDEVGTVGAPRQHKVIYTPTNTNYKAVELEVNITVTPIDPEYNIGSLTATYGDTLADVTLPEGFTWNDATTTTVGDAGSNTFKVTFTPDDTTNYNTLTNIDATIIVGQKDPEYTIPTGLEGYEGQPLSSIDIEAFTGFSWTNANTILPLIKDNGAIFETTMTFTPADTKNYKTVENIPVEVRVKENEIIALRVTSTKIDGSNPEYFEGQTFNRNDILVEAEWAIGGWQEVTDYELLDKDENALDRALEQTDTKVIVSYAEKTAEQPITVKEDYITDITITAPNKLDYNYKDEINLAGATITKVWASGLTHANDTMPMTLDMLSIKEQPMFDFNAMNKVGTHTVTVTVDGNTSKNTFEITVKDEIVGIEIEHPEKLQKDYFYGDSIKVTDKDTGDKLNVLVKYAGETPDEKVELTTDMISVDNTNVEDGKVVTVTYRDNKGKAYTDKYTINVKDYIKDIKVINNKSIYKIGESGVLDIEVSGIWASNSSTTPIAINPGTVDTSFAGSKTITISYINGKGQTLAKDVTVKVIDATEDIFISNLPKQTYNYGETLSLVNGTITVKTLSNPNGKIIPMTDSSVTVNGYNKNLLGNQSLTVTYTYTEETENGMETKIWTDTYTVTVNNYETDRIQITPPTKRTYDYGESLDLTGGKVSKVMADGSLIDTIDLTGEMITGYDATKIGAQTLTVTYDGKTTTFDVTVVDRTLGISMNKLPEKTEYTQGEAIDITGATINVTKLSGIKEIPVTKEMISGYDPNKVGTQVITVTYDGKQTEFVINVKEADKKPVLPEKPSRPTNPTKPSSSEVVKYTVTFIDYDGTVLKTEEVEKGKSATAPDVQERIGYKFLEWNRVFDVVEEDIVVMAKYERSTTAEVKAPDNMQVEKGEDIDLSEVTLIIKDEDGNQIDEIPVTEDMISGFNSEKVGTQIITVTYVDEDGFEYTATFKIKVTRPTEVLGVKDEVDATENNNLNGIIIPSAIGVGTIGLLLLLIAFATRKNVKIYALTEDERKLIGKEKITKHDRRIMLDEYEKKLENANIEIVLNKKITRKLDEEMIDIIFKGKKSTYKVKDIDDREFTIKMKNI